MKELNHLLSSAADTFLIHSANRFSIFGVSHEATDAEVDLEDSLLTEGARDLLAEVLYATLHCRTSADETEDPADWAGTRQFILGLSTANRGSDSWQPGWIIRDFELDGKIVAEKYGILFWLQPSDFRSGSLGPQVGGSGSVRVPKECWN